MEAHSGSCEDHLTKRILEMIDRHMREHPESVRPLSPDLLRRVDELVGHLEVDPDEDLGDGAVLP